MRIRKKTLVIIGTTVIGMVLVISVLSQLILLGSFSNLEQKNAQQNTNKVVSIISYEIADLDSKVSDYSNWNDTYNYVVDLNSAYYQSNLAPNIIDTAFTNLRVNVLILVNSTGATVFSDSFDLQNSNEAQLSPIFVTELLKTDKLWNFENTSSFVDGIVLSPNGPIIIASKPILTNEATGPSHGAVIMGRYLNANEIAFVSDTAHLPVKIMNYYSADLPADFQNARSANLNGSVFVQPLDSKTVGGYEILNDIYGSPALILNVDMPRDIYSQGQTTVDYFIMAMVVSSIFFIIVTIVLIEKVVLSRVTKLTDSVKESSKTGASKLKFSITENDELSTLASEINGMLCEIEDKKLKLKKTERLAAIGELAAMVGHDLRNPLAGIKNASYYLKKRLGPNMDGKISEVLDLIDYDIIYSNKIVSDLVDYSRDIHLEFSRVTPKKLFSEILPMVNIPSNIAVVDNTSAEKMIEVDKDKMKRVFINLIANAVDAMPHGGSIVLSNTEEGGKAKVIVSDTGIGMTDDVKQKLWTPLFTTKAKGMGLGLPICKRIVEAHKGTISAKSEAGKGTTFTVELPIKSQDGGENVE